jgi:hypothetical protein
MGCYLLAHYPSLHTSPNSFGDLSLSPTTQPPAAPLSLLIQPPELPLPAHAPAGPSSSSRVQSDAPPSCTQSAATAAARWVPTPPTWGPPLSQRASRNWGRATDGGSPRLTPKSKATGRPTYPTRLSTYTPFKRRFSDALKTMAYIRPKVARPFPRLCASGSYMHRAAHQMEKWTWTTTEKRICENNK